MACWLVLFPVQIEDEFAPLVKMKTEEITALSFTIDAATMGGVIGVRSFLRLTFPLETPYWE